MQSTIDTNRKSWFITDRNIKMYQQNNMDKPSKSEGKGLLKRQSRVVSTPDLDTSSKYVMAIREAFEKNRGMNEDVNQN
jgi:hypothetical protein|tara:strand:- start:25 stop:261 length:237 start_codon:yes stop_codon:yes gene_type:complete